MTPDEYAEQGRGRVGGTMDAETYSQQWTADLMVADMTRDRSLQTQQRILGVSDIMGCRSYAARFLNGDPFTDGDTSSASMLGTAIHAYVLPIIAEARDVAVEVPLEVKLSNGMEVLGHADLIDEPDVIDVKTVNGLAGVKRHGADPQQKMQRHLYGAGYVQVGGKVERVGNVWMDRNDLLAPPHVELEPYDPTYLDTAATWVDEVMYHVDNDLIDDAPRDKDIFWCRQFCPFNTACRGPENRPDDGEVIESDELAVAAALRREALDMEREAKDLRKASDAVLDRVQDAKVVVAHSDGRRFRVASTFVNGGPVAYERSGYYKLDVKELT